MRLAAHLRGRKFLVHLERRRPRLRLVVASTRLCPTSPSCAAEGGCAPVLHKPRTKTRFERRLQSLVDIDRSYLPAWVLASSGPDVIADSRESRSTDSSSITS